MSADDTAPIQFAGFFLEWDRIEDDKAELAEQSKDLFKAMKDGGYDTKAARAIFRERRVELNATPDDRAKADEAEAINDLYRSALARGLAARAHPAHSARENIEQFGAAKGVDAGSTPPREPTQEQPVEPARTSSVDAAVTAENDLRDPVAAEQGQIIREGDAPRETDCQAGEISQGGSDASCPDTEHHSPAVLPGKADKTSEAVAPPASSLVANSAMTAKTKGDVIRLLRPFCKHADDLGKCGGQSSRHCNDCEQIKRAASIREDA